MMNEKKTNFSLACTLLSKMVKEKGSLADLALAKGMHVPPTTMDLLSGLEVSADNLQADTACDTDSVPRRSGATKCMDLFPVDTKEPEPEPEPEPEQSKSQLTIFYGGKVFVFDEFPAEKAKDLMQMATNVSPSATAAAAVATAPVTADRLPESRPSTSAGLAPVKLNHSTELLAQTRRASLHRFLNKRKERINAKAPYQVNGSPKKNETVAKPEETQPWLGLGQEISKTARSEYR